MALALNNLKRVDMPLNKENNQAEERRSFSKQNTVAEISSKEYTIGQSSI